MSDAIICPQCQTAHYADEPYCENCGADMSTAMRATDEDPFAFEEIAPVPESNAADQSDDALELTEIPVEPLEAVDAEPLELAEVPVEPLAPAAPQGLEKSGYEEFPEVSVEAELAGDDDIVFDAPVDEPFESLAPPAAPLDAPFNQENNDSLAPAADAPAEFDNELPEAAPVATIEAHRTTPRHTTQVEPLPSPGTYEEPALLTLYRDQKALETYAIELDTLLIGRGESADDDEPAPEAAYSPHIDLAPYGSEEVARRQVAIYRQHKNYIVYNLAARGTQFNDELLGLGERRRLSEGDTLVIAEKVALRFSLPA
ncbi:hypothetical protein DL240_03680 [Lujinxingia litoralis]|uniref:FHA domain-containing protein n=1 Tax=Lujinxingia litoralis TaxID=2211119 RepID=A0A328CEH1_9DELT|nr:FHA domain-containing protein [Lujinxingia litoralis]RAL25323.1 hypothetical protein DL240_03680 [Lujinxingia litoralis]